MKTHQKTKLHEWQLGWNLRQRLSNLAVGPHLEDGDLRMFIDDGLVERAVNVGVPVFRVSPNISLDKLRDYTATFRVVRDAVERLDDDEDGPLYMKFWKGKSTRMRFISDQHLGASAGVMGPAGVTWTHRTDKVKKP